MNKFTTLALLSVAMLSVPTLAAADVNQPEEIIDRPRVLPLGELEVNGTLDIASIQETSTNGAGALFTSTHSDGFLTIGAGYGFVKGCELRGAYTFGINNFDDGQGALSITAACSLPSNGPLSMAIDAGSGYVIDGSSVLPFTVGVDLQYKLNSQWALFTPGQQLSIVFSGGSGPVLGGGGTSGTTSVALALPVGVRFQAQHNIFLFAETELGNINLGHSSNALLFSDFVPLQLGGYFSPNHQLDLGAFLNFADLKNESGVVDFELTARAFF